MLNVVESVGISPTALGVGRRERRGRSIAMLDAVGIGGYVEKLPDQLPGASSSGWPWRAPVKRPRLLLADEPAGALDEGSAEQVMDLMREPQRSFGTALIMATHDALVVRHASVGRRLASGHVEVVREREGSGTRSPRPRWASARFPLGSAWGMAGRLVLLRAVAAVAPASSCGACPADGDGTIAHGRNGWYEEGEPPDVELRFDEASPDALASLPAAEGVDSAVTRHDREGAHRCRGAEGSGRLGGPRAGDDRRSGRRPAGAPRSPGASVFRGPSS